MSPNDLLHNNCEFPLSEIEWITYNYFIRKFSNIWPTFRSRDIINEEDFEQKKVKHFSRKSL
jgi:hypothetical protein